MNILKLIGRDSEIFENDIKTYENELQNIIQESSFLVIGGAGSIGQAVTKEISAAGTSATHSKVRSPGQEIVGGVVSLMVMVWVQVEVFPQSSSA